MTSRVADLLVLSRRLKPAGPSLLGVASALANAVSLDLLALRNELLGLGEVEFEEQVELVADRAGKVEFRRCLWRVEVPRLDLEEFLGALPPPLGLLVAPLGLVAEVSHLDVLGDLGVPLERLLADDRRTRQASEAKILSEEFESLGSLP